MRWLVVATAFLAVGCGQPLVAPLRPAEMPVRPPRDAPPVLVTTPTVTSTVTVIVVPVKPPTPTWSQPWGSGLGKG